MGYVDKTELMETLKTSELFSEEEINIIDSLIEADRIYENEAILKLSTVNTLEDCGLLKKFYDVCKQKKYFPQWLENVERGIDKIAF